MTLLWTTSSVPGCHDRQRISTCQRTRVEFRCDHRRARSGCTYTNTQSCAGRHSSSKAREGRVRNRGHTDDTSYVGSLSSTSGGARHKTGGSAKGRADRHGAGNDFPRVWHGHRPAYSLCPTSTRSTVAKQAILVAVYDGVRLGICVRVQPTIKANRIRLNLPPDPRVIVPKPVVPVAGLGIVVTLPLKTVSLAE